MKLAVLHHHLNPGGVTRVIASHLLSLDATAASDEHVDVLLISDGQLGGWSDDVAQQLQSIRLNFATIPEIGYCDAAADEGENLAVKIRETLVGHGFVPGETILHAHNHSLGKNPSYPTALKHLAKRGYGLLLQPHDFAEDFRPENYRLLQQSFAPGELGTHVYFRGPRIHYATLNRRDNDVLRRAGIDPERLHFLPNPVPELPGLPARSDARLRLQEQLAIAPEDEYVLYPVRGIRRKNVGEFVLLSLLRNAQRRLDRHEGRSVFGITLAPLNPAALPYYERWKSLSDELQLACRFSVGGDEGLSFTENLAAADRIVTTSVAEGFGMVFLESWLSGSPLVGRNLPEVTADFIDTGLRLDSLYNRLNVPIDWIGRDRLVQEILVTSRQVCDAYGIAQPTLEDVTNTVEASSDGGLVDFGRLDEPLQELVIRRVHADEAAAELLLTLNPSIQQWDARAAADVEANQAAIRAHYSLQASGQRLRAIYRSIQATQESGLDSPASAESILHSYLDLDRLCLIRT